MELARISHQSQLYKWVLTLSTSVLFALSAWISIPLPFTPVPVSLTCQLILMASILLGRQGSYATFLYLGQGLLGLPVFAGGGCGLGYFLGPTGGYLLGFGVASLLLGWMSEQMQERVAHKTLILMLLGTVTIYLFGIPHLAFFYGWKGALDLGLYPFVGADALKLILAQRGLQRLVHAYRLPR